VLQAKREAEGLTQEDLAKRAKGGPELTRRWPCSSASPRPSACRWPSRCH